MSEFGRIENLTPGVRLRRIQELLDVRGSLSLREALAEINVSEMTLRRDFVTLERLGVAERTWGGILARRPLVPELGVDERERTQAEAKRSIAALADTLIAPGETVLLSGGTTALAVARRLAHRDQLTIVTTSLPALMMLSGNPGLVVIALGGRTSPYNHDTTGPLAHEALSRYRADKAVIGATGISAEGIFNANLERATTDRMMVEHARSTLVVADHTKVGRDALVLVAPLAPTITLATDVALPPHARQWFGQASATVATPASQRRRGGAPHSPARSARSSSPRPQAARKKEL